MPGRFYVDTSAYLAILLGETGSAPLVRELSGGKLMTSSLLALEAYRSLVNLSRSGILSAADLQTAVTRLGTDLQRFAIRDLTIDLCSARLMPVVSTPRTLDLAHLSTAVWFHGRTPLDRFVSMDAKQNISARELALPV